MTEPTSDTPAKEAKPVLLKCTVLISGTVIGKLKLAKGHKCHIEADKARALNNLTPPAVSIDGV